MADTPVRRRPAPAPAATPAPEPVRRRPAPVTAPQSAIDKVAEQVAESALSEPQKREPVNTDIMISTGSTLLDLAISGGIIRGGGIPGGILVEMYGPSGTGKSAVMCEILGNVQRKGGLTSTQDPEGRLNAGYAKVYGMNIDPKSYDRPDTVVQAFTNTRKFIASHFRKKKTDPINAIGTDSLAALSSELEMSKDGDKMGMKKAKDLNQEMRLTCRDIANSGNLVICTNQERGEGYDAKTPGGQAVGYYASVRLRLTPDHANDVKKDVKVKEVLGIVDEDDEDDPNTRTEAKKGRKGKSEKGQVEKVLGIRTNIAVVKSSVDDPYRMAYVYIVFGYGIDDVRANLQWMKDMLQTTTYVTPSGKKFQGIAQAIDSVEKYGEEAALREQVIDLWEAIENALKVKRKPKVRI